MFTANASAAIDPHLRLKDAELDGVDAEVIFGILGVLPVSAAGEQAKDSPAHRDDHAGHSASLGGGPAWKTNGPPGTGSVNTPSRTRAGKWTFSSLDVLKK